MNEAARSLAKKIASEVWNLKQVEFFPLGQEQKD